ncbi:MAG TPA: hypothetical protein EYO05_03525, partial [Gammaproteobacteria bacterium]|nr:hypothetical protein [Gammaproteobacteria bacterium]
DVPKRGDAVPLAVQGLPLILVRDNDDNIRVLQNVCRHRATIVLDKPCEGLTNFKCPYHGWTYDLTGGLIATPFWDGTAGSRDNPVDPLNNSLVPVRSHVWNHVVFINIDGKASSLCDYLEPMDRELAHLDIDSLEIGHSQTWDFRANWKLVMENWEVYHHVWVHEGVFDKMSDEVDLNSGEPYTDMIADGNTMMLRANDRRPPIPQPVEGSSGYLPLLPKKWEPDGHTSAANAVLPNTTVTIGSMAYAPAVYVPVAPGLTQARMAWYFAPGVVGAEQFDEAVCKVLNRWLGPERKLTDRRGIRPQDHRCMELQQQARSSPIANDVKFSTTWEQNVRYFQNWLVNHIDSV